MRHRLPPPLVHVRVGLLAALSLLGLASSAWAASSVFEITLPASVAKQPISGRLFVFVQSLPNSAAGGAALALPEPRFGPNWFGPEPFFGLDVHDFAPGQSRRIDDQADGFPDKLSNLPPGRYRVQAVLHHNPDTEFPGRGEGNFYSAARRGIEHAARPRCDYVLGLRGAGGNVARFALGEFRKFRCAATCLSRFIIAMYCKSAAWCCPPHITISPSGDIRLFF